MLFVPLSAVPLVPNLTVFLMAPVLFVPLSAVPLVPNLTVFLMAPVLFVPLSAVPLVPGRSRPVVRMAPAFAVGLTKLSITIIRGQIPLLSGKGASVVDSVMILG